MSFFGNEDGKQPVYTIPQGVKSMTVRYWHVANVINDASRAMKHDTRENFCETSETCRTPNAREGTSHVPKDQQHIERHGDTTESNKENQKEILISSLEHGTITK